MRSYSGLKSNELTSAFDLLNESFSGYENRPQQIEMAEEILDCFKNEERLLVEAGTGVGKSFAYLIPAILTGKKTVVSTATIALQEQLVKKDLAFLQRTLPQEFSYSILKGKNNYLCLKREREFTELSKQYTKFREWLSITGTGDKDELNFIPDFWSKVCGDSNDCNAVKCPFYNNCFYYRHYRELRKKDILVVNHHLLFYDLLSGFSVLPFHNQLIIDEAHQIENIISDVFGNVLNQSRIVWLLYRLRSLKIAVDHLFEPVNSFFSLKPHLSHPVQPIPDDVVEALDNLKSLLAPDKVIQRLDDCKHSLSDNELADRSETTINYVISLKNTIDDFIEQGDKDKVYYLTKGTKYLELRSNLVESQRPFGDLINGYDSMVLTSATMTSGGNFNFLKARLGITDSLSGAGTSFKEKLIGSPFDFKKQAMIYIDQKLPAPDKQNNKAYYKSSLKAIERLISASKGRALILFTSYDHLNFVSKNIRIDYPFKSQGNMPPARLIKWFKKTPNSVLLATATFWQGIDIKGDKLSMVVIAKMPFGSPGDPVYDERCRRLGDRWFKDLALPSAILLLRQGFGRLIRGVNDYGVVAILDSRLASSFYGRTVLSSLPDTNIAHKIEDVEKFYNSLPQRLFEEDNMDEMEISEPKKTTGIKRISALGESGINNPYEKEYNILLAKRLIGKSNGNSGD